MKILSIVLLLLPASAWCQQNSNLATDPGIQAERKEAQATLLHRLPNEAVVYALPQDGMPCIVPPKQQIDGINRATGTSNSPVQYHMPIVGQRERPLIPMAGNAHNFQLSSTLPPKAGQQHTFSLIPSPLPLPDWKEQLPKLQKKLIQP